MPISVVFASTLQFLLAATFSVIPVVAYRYGGGAQRAAEAEVARQGFPAGVLAEHRVRFEESGRETLLPFAIAGCLMTLASLNLAGVEAGRILSWVLEPIVLIAGGLVTVGQVYAARSTELVFRKSSDTTLRDIDARAIIGAATGAFPSWLHSLQIVRFALTTLGSLLVIIFLATPATSAYFH